MTLLTDQMMGSQRNTRWSRLQGRHQAGFGPMLLTISFSPIESSTQHTFTVTYHMCVFCVRLRGHRKKHTVLSPGSLFPVRG